MGIICPHHFRTAKRVVSEDLRAVILERHSGQIYVIWAFLFPKYWVLGYFCCGVLKMSFWGPFGDKLGFFGASLQRKKQKDRAFRVCRGVFLSHWLNANLRKFLGFRYVWIFISICLGGVRNYNTIFTSMPTFWRILFKCSRFRAARKFGPNWVLPGWILWWFEGCMGFKMNKGTWEGENEEKGSPHKNNPPPPPNKKTKWYKSTKNGFLEVLKVEVGRRWQR